MLNVETDLGTFSYTVAHGDEVFVGENGQAHPRATVIVDIWQHVNYADRKYGQLVKAATGTCFCQPNDKYDFYYGAKNALQKALDQLSFTDGKSPINRLFHQSLRLFVERGGYSNG